MGSGDADYLALDDAGLLAQCDVHTYRASGPGGQKRNKTSSAVRLRHDPTGLAVVGTESRSQHENKRRALRRLRLCIALGVRRAFDAERDEPSEALRASIAPDGRLQCGRRDARYPTVVRDLLDVFFANQGRTADTAGALGISTAHLISFLRNDPKLWGRANQFRAEFGHPALK